MDTPNKPTFEVAGDSGSPEAGKQYGEVLRSIFKGLWIAIKAIAKATWVSIKVSFKIFWKVAKVFVKVFWCVAKVFLKIFWKIFKTFFKILWEIVSSFRLSFDPGTKIRLRQPGKKRRR